MIQFYLDYILIAKGHLFQQWRQAILQPIIHYKTMILSLKCHPLFCQKTSIVTGYTATTKTLSIFFIFLRLFCQGRFWGFCQMATKVEGLKGDKRQSQSNRPIQFEMNPGVG